VLGIKKSLISTVEQYFSSMQSRNPTADFPNQPQSTITRTHSEIDSDSVHLDNTINKQIDLYNNSFHLNLFDIAIAVGIGLLLLLLVYFLINSKIKYHENQIYNIQNRSGSSGNSSSKKS